MSAVCEGCQPVLSTDQRWFVNPPPSMNLPPWYWAMQRPSDTIGSCAPASSLLISSCLLLNPVSARSPAQHTGHGPLTLVADSTNGRASGPVHCSCALSGIRRCMRGSSVLRRRPFCPCSIRSELACLRAERTSRKGMLQRQAAATNPPAEQPKSRTRHSR